jgi:integrase
VREWFERWLDYLYEHDKSTAQYRSNFENWIEPALGIRPIADVTSEELRTFVATLDDAIDSGKIRWKHAGNIWGTLSAALKKYAGPKSKVKELRARLDDPTTDVASPKRGVETAKVHLYPAEFLKLVSCDAVPLKRRRYYAVATYGYLRAGETEAFAWSDIDLPSETATIQRSLDRERDNIEKSTKNGKARLTASIEPELVPLLRAMHQESGGVGRVFGKLGDESQLAALVRADLLTAGVTRHELHHASDKPPRNWMTFHDLRTTGISWMAARGDDAFTIVARAGHSDIKMTEHYVKIAAVLRRTYGKGDVFPPLPASLLVVAADAENDSGEDDDGPASAPRPRAIPEATEATVEPDSCPPSCGHTCGLVGTNLFKNTGDLRKHMGIEPESPRAIPSLISRVIREWPTGKPKTHRGRSASTSRTPLPEKGL